jgi:hypothetical protein
MEDQAHDEPIPEAELKVSYNDLQFDRGRVRSNMFVASNVNSIVELWTESQPPVDYSHQTGISHANVAMSESWSASNEPYRPQTCMAQTLPIMSDLNADPAVSLEDRGVNGTSLSEIQQLLIPKHIGIGTRARVLMHCQSCNSEVICYDDIYGNITHENPDRDKFFCGGKGNDTLHTYCLTHPVQPSFIWTNLALVLLNMCPEQLLPGREH